MYDFPAEGRAFAKDYRDVAERAGTRLARDIDGRDLVAEHVVGRRVVGGEDQAFPAPQYDALTAAGTGRSAQAVPAGTMGQELGRTFTKAGRPVAVSAVRRAPHSRTRENVSIGQALGTALPLPASRA